MTFLSSRYQLLCKHGYRYPGSGNKTFIYDYNVSWKFKNAISKVNS